MLPLWNISGLVPPLLSLRRSSPEALPPCPCRPIPLPWGPRRRPAAAAARGGPAAPAPGATTHHACRSSKSHGSNHPYMYPLHVLCQIFPASYTGSPEKVSRYNVQSGITIEEYFSRFYIPEEPSLLFF